jgi:hypothetical protein
MLMIFYTPQGIKKGSGKLGKKPKKAKAKANSPEEGEGGEKWV